MTTFTRTYLGTYDAASDGRSPPVTTTISGSAIQVKGDPQAYQALGLVLSTAPTLLFSPDDYGLRAFTPDFVQPGDKVEWNGVTYTARDVQVTAPDGIVVISRIVVEVS